MRGRNFKQFKQSFTEHESITKELGEIERILNRLSLDANKILNQVNSRIRMDDEKQFHVTANTTTLRLSSFYRETSLHHQHLFELEEETGDDLFSLAVLTLTDYAKLYLFLDCCERLIRMHSYSHQREDVIKFGVVSIGWQNFLEHIGVRYFPSSYVLSQCVFPGLGGLSGMILASLCTQHFLKKSQNGISISSRPFLTYLLSQTLITPLSEGLWKPIWDLAIAASEKYSGVIAPLVKFSTAFPLFLGFAILFCGLQNIINYFTQPHDKKRFHAGHKYAAKLAVAHTAFGATADLGAFLRFGSRNSSVAALCNTIAGAFTTSAGAFTIASAQHKEMLDEVHKIIRTIITTAGEVQISEQNQILNMPLSEEHKEHKEKPLIVKDELKELHTSLEQRSKPAALPAQLLIFSGKVVALPAKIAYGTASTIYNAFAECRRRKREEIRGVRGIPLLTTSIN